MSNPKQLSLIDWYLAALRRRASQQNKSAKLTPMALVQSDKSLIQELVAKSSESQQVRESKFLSRIQQENKTIRATIPLMIGISAATVLIMIVILLV